MDLAKVYERLQEIQGMIRQGRIEEALYALEDLKEILCVGEVK